MSLVRVPMVGRRTEEKRGRRTTVSGWASRLTAAFALLAVLCGSAGATVTAYTGPLPADEAPSPYFSAWADNISLHVYQAPVRSVNFDNFTSGFNGVTYDAAAGASNGTSNLGTGSFASFMLSGSTDTTVAISFPTVLPGGFHPAPLTSTSQIKILPTGAATATLKNSNTVLFQVSPQTVGQQFTVEFDGDWMNSIHIFVNPYQAPPAAPNVPTSTQTSPTTQASFNALGITGPVVFGPGEYWIQGNLAFKTGGEIYLADGAILKRTSFTPSGGTNVANSGPMLAIGNNYPNNDFSVYVHGPGILDGSAPLIYTTNYGCGTAAYPIQMTNGSTLTGTTIKFSDFIIRNACSWNFPIANVLATQTNPTVVDNIKVIGFSGNTSYTQPDGTVKGEAESDGMDIGQVNWLTVQHSFFRTMDDLVVIYQGRSVSPAYPTTNVSVHDNILWNEFAHAMLIGPMQYNAPNGSNPPVATDHVTFDHNTVIHDTGVTFLMGAYNITPGLVQNVTWSNITVEEDRGLISLGSELPTGQTGTPPPIGPMTFSNINVTSAQKYQTIAGTNIHLQPNIQMFVRVPSSDSSWQGTGASVLLGPVTMQHVYMNGTLVNSAAAGGDYDSGLTAQPAPAVLLQTVEYRTSSLFTEHDAWVPNDMVTTTSSPALTFLP